MGYAVEAIDLVKVYRVGKREVWALRGLNLKVKEGEFLAVVGPSGSGKSTLLNLIGALDRPTSGAVLVDGIDTSKLSDSELSRFRNEKIGFVFQSFNLINRISVIRNVELPAMVKGTPKDVRERRARELLEEVGLGDKIYMKPLELSGGEQQRVAIARALINNPRFVLADEPTGNLDSVTSKEIYRLLRRLNRMHGTTVIVVTHDLELAQECDRIVYLRDGKVEREVIPVER
ncbi:MAG: ABC transporter ATP-binding protein [Thaumarchaeota archaeon]|nr:ABC transporter ATP-binding protein [Nitrososphaerota archaeon]